MRRAPVVAVHLAFGMALLAAGTLTAQEWTPEQKGVLKSLKAYHDVSMKADVKGVLEFIHPDFYGWDYSQQQPIDYAGVKAMLEGFYGAHELLTMDMKPMSVQVVGEFAIAHVYFDESFKDSAGMTTRMTGRWTITLVKKDDKWVHLAWTWLGNEETT